MCLRKEFDTYCCRSINWRRLRKSVSILIIRRRVYRACRRSGEQTTLSVSRNIAVYTVCLLYIPQLHASQIIVFIPVGTRRFSPYIDNCLRIKHHLIPNVNNSHILPLPQTAFTAEYTVQIYITESTKFLILLTNNVILQL